MREHVEDEIRPCPECDTPMPVEVGERMSGYRLRDEHGNHRPLTEAEAEPVTVTLPREAMGRVHALLVWRAVTVEAAEQEICAGLDPESWWWPADEVRRALVSAAEHGIGIGEAS